MAAKHYGIHRAVVVNVDDPKRLDRIKVRVPEVLGNEITDWVWPKHPATFWSWKPIVGSPVWVEFEAGDVDRPLYSGTWYPQYKGSSTIPYESKAEYPFHRMIATPRGHKIGIQGYQHTSKRKYQERGGYRRLDELYAPIDADSRRKASWTHRRTEQYQRFRTRLDSDSEGQHDWTI